MVTPMRGAPGGPLLVRPVVAAPVSPRGRVCGRSLGFHFASQRLSPVGSFVAEVLAQRARSRHGPHLGDR